MAGGLVGVILGSFLATVVIRWPQGRSVLRGRSRCDSCREALAARELVPLVSFVLAKGRCRRCDCAIDPAHFAVEFAAALIGAVALLAHPGLLGLVSAVFGLWLLLLAALDAQHHWLPDRLTLPLMPVGLTAGLLGFGPELDSRLIGAGAGIMILAGVGFAYRRLRGREGLGGGDPKLFGGLGAWLGWEQLPLVLLGAGLLGLSTLLMKHVLGGAVSATDRLPLGTLVALAAWPIWLVIAPVVGP